MQPAAPCPTSWYILLSDGVRLPIFTSGVSAAGFPSTTPRGAAALLGLDDQEHAFRLEPICSVPVDSGTMYCGVMVHFPFRLHPRFRACARAHSRWACPAPVSPP